MKQNHSNQQQTGQEPVIVSGTGNVSAMVPRHHGHKIWLLLIPLVALIIGASFFVFSKNEEVLPPITKLSSGSYGIKAHACDILTQDRALPLMGAGGLATTRDKDILLSQQKDKDVKTSNCHYDTYLPAKGAPSYTVVLAVKTPLTLKGATSIQAVFYTKRPEGSEKVKKYGDAAFWVKKSGELNILKHNTWYTLTYGPPKAADRTLDQTKKLADALLPKL